MGVPLIKLFVHIPKKNNYVLSVLNLVGKHRTECLKRKFRLPIYYVAEDAIYRENSNANVLTDANIKARLIRSK